MAEYTEANKGLYSYTCLEWDDEASNVWWPISMELQAYQSLQVQAHVGPTKAKTAWSRGHRLILDEDEDDVDGDEADNFCIRDIFMLVCGHDRASFNPDFYAWTYFFNWTKL